MRSHVPNTYEKTMVSIGDCCPLFFSPLKYKYSSTGHFRQVFSTSDNILLQVFCDEGEVPSASLNDRLKKTSSPIIFLTYSVNDPVKMYYASLSPVEGIYTVTINGRESEEFSVCENVGDNILVEYSHKDNNSVFDNIFWLDEARQIFHFRVVGGFRPDGVGLKVDNEQFSNQKQEIIELYSMPYKTFDFVFGDSNGVPYYIAEFMNKIFCLSYVKVNGDQYVREGDSVPEKLDTIGRKQQFIYKITLRPAENDIAGIGGKTEIATSSSGVAFMLKNPEDDDILVYKRSESAFVNQNYL